jgi:hypothetical protein
LKDIFECTRCRIGTRHLFFESQEKLDEHKLKQHGEVTKEQHLNAKDTLVHRIFMKHYGDEL